MKIINSLIFLIVFFVACSSDVNSERDKEFLGEMYKWKEHLQC